MAMAGCESANQVKWEPFSQEKIGEAAQSGKPVVAYFYAAWCSSCYRLREKTFSNPQVVQVLDRYVRLKADLSYRSSEKTIEVSRLYQIQGVPTVILFDAQGNQAGRFSGFIPPDQFLKFLKRINEPSQA